MYISSNRGSQDSLAEDLFRENPQTFLKNILTFSQNIIISFHKRLSELRRFQDFLIENLKILSLKSQDLIEKLRIFWWKSSRSSHRRAQDQLIKELKIYSQKISNYSHRRSSNIFIEYPKIFSWRISSCSHRRSQDLLMDDL